MLISLSLFTELFLISLKYFHKSLSVLYNLYHETKIRKSLEPYDLMLSRGYPEEFCDAVTRNLNTDFTAKRMLGYFRYIKHPSPEDVADICA